MAESQFQTSCGVCGGTMTVLASWHGTTVQCPRCHQPTVVGGAGAVGVPGMPAPPIGAPGYGAPAGGMAPGMAPPGMYAPPGAEMYAPPPPAGYGGVAPRRAGWSPVTKLIVFVGIPVVLLLTAWATVRSLGLSQAEQGYLVGKWRLVKSTQSGAAGTGGTIQCRMDLRADKTYRCTIDGPGGSIAFSGTWSINLLRRLELRILQGQQAKDIFKSDRVPWWVLSVTADELKLKVTDGEEHYVRDK